MRNLVYLIAIASLSSTAFAADAPSSQPATPPKPQSFSDQYGVIAQRNIFVRDRVRPRDPGSRNNNPTTSRSNERPALTPEQSYVLRGIVLEDDDLRAYFEDKRSGVVTRVATGAVLAEGRVVEILIDSVRFENAGRLTWVEIGHDLTGSQSGGGSSSSPPSLSSSTQPAAPTDPATLSIAERMKQRAEEARKRRQGSNP